MKFTQKIKDKWLEALRSGKYVQGYGRLQYKDKETEVQRHCCIGVLGKVTRGLSDSVFDTKSCPYTFLRGTIGEQKMDNLWETNDGGKPTDYKDDYSNVIPLIEALEVSS